MLTVFGASESLPTEVRSDTSGYRSLEVATSVGSIVQVSCVIVHALATEGKV